MTRFSNKELTKNNEQTVEKKAVKVKKNAKYITVIRNGEKHMTMNPNHVRPHIDK